MECSNYLIVGNGDADDDDDNNGDIRASKGGGKFMGLFFLVKGRLVVGCNCLEMWSFVPILSCSDSMLGLSVKSGCKL